MSAQAPNGKALAEFVVYITRIAAEKRESAAHGGSWDDGGARKLEEDTKIWHAGLEGKIPEALTPVWKEYQNSKDPEYAKYLELKKKYEQ